jgi:hypothetical protein
MDADSEISCNVGIDTLRAAMRAGLVESVPIHLIFMDRSFHDA